MGNESEIKNKKIVKMVLSSVNGFDLFIGCI